MVLGAVLLRRALRERHKAEEQLRRASGAFMDLLKERFEEWGLTPSERDVALFAIKGMSTAEIATLRSTSEGTVKAQTNAIYRKAGVSGRSQLLSLFIEDLMRDDGAVRAAATAGDISEVRRLAPGTGVTGLKSREQRLFQNLQRDDRKRRLVRGGKPDLRGGPFLMRLQEPGGAEAPLVAGLEA